MLFDFFLFSVSFAALAFSFSGYLLSLALIRTLRASRESAELFDHSALESLPHVNFIVPTFNEGLFIQNKLRNLFALDYPPNLLRIWICDGGSTDATRAEVERLRPELGPTELHFLVAPVPGKIGQMNLALAQIPADELVVVTDADALIHTKEALKKTAAAFAKEPELGLVGGWTNPDPKSALQTELAHWDKQNRARFLETVTYSASIVVAPYYAFRRSLIKLFPEDCVADDVYISYVAHLRRLRVLYTPAIQVTELRSPRGFRQMFFHKFRKAHAYTSELFRVLYLLPYMRKRVKYFYLTKMFQFFYLPWAFLFLFIESFIMASAGYAHIVLTFYALFLVLILGTSYMLKPPPGLSRGGITLVSFVASVEIFLVMNVVLILNSVAFPFWRQNANYAKVGA